MGKKGIPERWLDYNSMGRQIPGTRFIAFKVPLKDTLLKSLPSMEDLFDTRYVMDHISNLGLIIDLTNTDRYYDPEDFQKNNIIYHKLKTGGHILPSEGVMRRFCFLVENFLEKNKNNDKVIGVHCTHGLNRSGYIICRYMIQQLGVAPDQAISDFNSARGYNIERENYLEDLRKASWPKIKVSLEMPVQYFDRRNSFRGSNVGNNYPDRYKWTRSRESELDVRRNSRGEDNNGLQVGEYLPRREFRTPYNSPYERGVGRHSWRLRRSESGFERSPFNSPVPGSGSRLRESFHSNELDRSRELDPPERNIDMSPFLMAGKELYQKYFGESRASQYDSDFYSRGGPSGIGPHRPLPRYIPQPNEGAPRQYRGPRLYIPPKLDDYERSTGSSHLNPSTGTPGRPMSSNPTAQTFSPDFKSPSNGDHLKFVTGRGRSVFSPGARNNVFSPEEPEYFKRGRRYQPY